MNNILKRVLRSKRKGMSLVEIMLVMMLVISGIVAVLTAFRTISNNMKKSSTNNTFRLVQNAIEQFNLEVGRYPTGLEELYTRPTAQNETRKWQGPYIEDPEKNLKDAWGNPLEYKIEADGKGHLSSLGSKGTEETRMYAQDL